jgi:hypothetical protein
MKSVGLRKTVLIAASALLVALLPTLGRAEEDAGAPGAAPVCAKTPTREVALQIRTLAESSIKIASSSLEPREDLAPWRDVPTTIRMATSSTRCAYPSFTAAKELGEAQAFVGRATKWADDFDARIAAEENARATIIVPLCEATWALENAKAAIAHEKANPSGVVDLHQLHLAGQEIQQRQAEIDALKPRYLTFRHHPFTGWRAEGACVVAARTPG